MSTDPQTSYGPSQIAGPGLVAILSLMTWLLFGGAALAKGSSVAATGTFTNGQGECGAPERFQDDFVVIVDGTKLTIEQPSTGDSVSGTVDGDGKFVLQNEGESYEGTVDGKRMEAAYTYTGNGCPTTYQAQFQLAEPLPLPQPAVTPGEPTDQDADQDATPEGSSGQVANESDSDSDVATTSDSGDATWLLWLIGILVTAGAALLIWKNPSSPGHEAAPELTAVAPDPSEDWLEKDAYRCASCRRIVAHQTLEANGWACPYCD